MTEPFEFKTKRNVNKSYLESFDMVDARLTQSFEPLWKVSTNILRSYFLLGDNNLKNHLSKKLK